jgi:Uma2 family endonuclease
VPSTRGVEVRVRPDWVCEILSRSTERIDRTRKLGIYAAAGVPHAWLVNPLDRFAEVLRLENGRWVLHETFAEADVVRAEPFGDVPVDLTQLWIDASKQ